MFNENGESKIAGRTSSSTADIFLQCSLGTNTVDDSLQPDSTMCGDNHFHRFYIFPFRYMENVLRYFLIDRLKPLIVKSAIIFVFPSSFYGLVSTHLESVQQYYSTGRFA